MCRAVPNCKALLIKQHFKKLRKFAILHGLPSEKPGSFTSEHFRYLHHLSQSRQACRAEFPSQRRRTTRLDLFKRWRRAFRGINLSPPTFPLSTSHSSRKIPFQNKETEGNLLSFVLLCAGRDIRVWKLPTPTVESTVYGADLVESSLSLLPVPEDKLSSQSTVFFFALGAKRAGTTSAWRRRRRIYVYRSPDSLFCEILLGQNGECCCKDGGKRDGFRGFWRLETDVMGLVPCRAQNCSPFFINHAIYIFFFNFVVSSPPNRVYFCWNVHLFVSRWFICAFYYNEH